MNKSPSKDGDATSQEVRTVQILRGLAALIVMIGHTVGKLKHEYSQEAMPDLFLSIWKVSALGVDVFFILSGIVMVLVTRDSQNKSNDIKCFVIKRVFRIYPIYWLAFIAYLSLLSLSNMLNTQPLLGHVELQPLITSLLLLPTTNNGSYYPYLGIAWTLVFEMFFYMVYAALLTLKIQSRLLTLNIIFVFLALTNFVLSSTFSSAYIHYYTNPIILEFIAGCWIGYLYKKGVLLGKTLAIPLAIIALILLSLSSHLEAPYVSFYNLNPWRFIIWGMPSIMLVYAIVSSEHLFQANAFRPMVALGNASYSLYLFHAALFLPVLGVIFSTLDVYAYIDVYTSTAVLSILCIAGSYLIYSLIERPLASILKRRMLCNEDTLSPQNRI
ncbi:acyltransferase family protein [Vibrio sp. DNB22_19_1]|uniref:acyltransferase family protein n=1 Tax=unclassified Vibrio TaxID=2614977 RepID=UPI00406A7A4C